MYFSSVLCIIFTPHAVSIVVLWSQYLSRFTCTFLSLLLFIPSCLTDLPLGIFFFSSTRDNQKFFLVKLISYYLSFCFKRFLVLFKNKYIRNFQLFALRTLSIESAFFHLLFFWELSHDCNCNFSKAAYLLSLDAFKIIFSLWYLKFHFAVSGCVFYFLIWPGMQWHLP